MRKKNVSDTRKQMLRDWEASALLPYIEDPQGSLRGIVTAENAIVVSRQERPRIILVSYPKNPHIGLHFHDGDSYFEFQSLRSDVGFR